MNFKLLTYSHCFSCGSMSIEQEIFDYEEKTKYYKKEKGKLLSFIGRLKDRYYL